MSSLLGVALSATLAAGPAGSNGFDPSSLYVLYDLPNQCSRTPGAVRPPACFAVDPGQSSEFVTWFQTETEVKAKALKYFVACALPADYTVKFTLGGKLYEWPGRYGLAEWTSNRLAGIQKEGKGGTLLILPEEEGKWVSACLMALSNTAGSHEYVSLRGIPPAWHGQAPGEATRWTMGYPEGVFFADVLNFNIDTNQATNEPTPQGTRSPPTKAQLEKSYTLSLNLPRGYPSAGSAGWAPPNASNGRTLDFDPDTPCASSPVGHYRAAKKLGTFEETKTHFLPVLSPSNSEYYKAQEICVDASSGGERVVGCTTPKVMHLRPLFVHAPRVASFGAASRTRDVNLVIQAIDSGSAPLAPGQWKSCVTGVDCTGPVKLNSEGEVPTAPSPVPPSRTLNGLTANQSVTVVLRRPSGSGAPASPDHYTAIVRYRSKVPATATIMVSDARTGLRPVGSSWPATPAEPGAGWQWLQIYPVDAVRDATDSDGRTALKIVISGKEGGGPAPELDIAGFVAGAPWCSGPVPSSVRICLK
jgi:hypothetical protein